MAGLQYNEQIVIDSPVTKYILDFELQLQFTILGTEHGLGTSDISVTCYDNSVPREAVGIGWTVHPTTFDVEITFALPMSGRIILR